MVAEKFHAMASLGDRNSRVKDLWDVACLALRFAFDGDTLRTAIAETFRQRGTSFTGRRPTALLAGYYDDQESLRAANTVARCEGRSGPTSTDRIASWKPASSCGVPWGRSATA